jgi:hypothetical protein
MDESTPATSIEAHPAASIDGCFRIEARLRSWGLDINLIGASRPPREQASALPVLCLYTGPDADPEADRWSDNRLANEPED